ncbi:MAG: selenium cofactor biosynthesis protein YqeC [Chloroflexi bacterium]|nr:selenium cofactor biosynthesis protein YqeC [Chloroflexota bacterium]
MTLVDALLTYGNTTVAFVGVGGKTAAMYTLARELARLRRRVVVTATAPQFPAIAEDAPAVFIVDDVEEIIPELTRRTRPFKWCVVARRGDNGSPQPVPEAWVERMQNLTDVDNVLVEADLAHGKVFKGPALGEPMIPTSARLVVSMTSIDAVGVPLNDENVHLPAVVATLAQAQVNRPLGATTIAAIMTQREGFTRGVNSLARVVPLINEVNDAAKMRTAMELLGSLRARGATRVVITRGGPTLTVLHAVIPVEERGVDPNIPQPEPLPYSQMG